jgi:hypothetical protein
MLTKTLATFGLVLTLGLGSVSAQEFPGLGVGNMLAMNMQFDQQMTQQAYDFSQAWLAERTRFRVENNYWGPMAAPFTAADLNRANLETSAAYDRQNASWHAGQASLSNMFERNSMANRGVWGYSDGMGGYAQLPYNTQTYFQDTMGQFHSGGTYNQVPDYWHPYTPYHIVN